MCRFLAIALMLIAGGARAVPVGHLAAVGAPVALLSNEQRLALGIKFGPDAPIDFFQAKNGTYYINSAGSLGQVDGPGRMAAFNVHVDSQLSRVLALNSNAPATGPQDVQTILTDYAAECGAGQHRKRASDPGGAVCMQYFDRDYAGGGTYFRCPDNQTSVYFYHGENHTAPDGTWGDGGWFGIGVGYFNADETAVTRASEIPIVGGRTSAQIFGLNLDTMWHGAPGAYAAPPQDKPYNGVPSAVPGGDGYLYVYHGNATMNPAYYPSACTPECMSVSRAPVAAFCSSVRGASPIAWQNYYNGRWSQPALQSAGAADGVGAGGAFTPLYATALPGEHGGTVTYLPTVHIYVMVRLYHGGIDARYSADGLNWSNARPLIGAPDGETPAGAPAMLIYPKVSVIHGAGGGEQYVLTYVVVTKGHFWRWAQLMREELAFGR